MKAGDWAVKWVVLLVATLVGGRVEQKAAEWAVHLAVWMVACWVEQMAVSSAAEMVDSLVERKA